ncbi:hypothetical protein ASE90_06800 [Sphingomonas sp. Leaf67]|uniref:hypothetical protein n=1 Tax=Sphingomonas sp. Leaf67 TaxID=1736230 RepID=UPI0006F35466|nr:hypothetical protein [Sphingomonas sp. Leaf67]KQN86980.1 hypothetical protein ASE90_06800 [Sphingomonas sp. Leaf67]
MTTVLLNAYGEPFDPGPLIEAWHESAASEVVRELWDNLYHQGSVNSASYAAVPGIVRMLEQAELPDWNGYALIASIEEARLAGGSVPMPVELAGDYETAWKSALPLALRDLREAQDDSLVRSLITVIALAKGQRTLAAIALCTEHERIEMLGG